MPSALTFKPCAASAVWICFTPGPVSPSPTLSLGLLTTRPAAVVVAVGGTTEEVATAGGSASGNDVDGVDLDVDTVTVETGASVANVVGDDLAVAVEAVEDAPLLQPAAPISATTHRAIPPRRGIRRAALGCMRRSWPIASFDPRQRG